MKKFLFLALIFCMVLPLAACGGKDDDGTQTTPPGQDSQGTGDTYLDSLPSVDYDMYEYQVLCTTQTEGFYNGKIQCDFQVHLDGRKHYR